MIKRRRKEQPPVPRTALEFVNLLPDYRKYNIHFKNFTRVENEAEGGEDDIVALFFHSDWLGRVGEMNRVSWDGTFSKVC